MRKRSGWWLAGWVLLLGCSLGAYVSSESWLPKLGTWLDVGEPPTKVDWLVVLPGDFETRPYVAAALYKAGYAQRILIPSTGTTPSERDGYVLRHHDIIQRILEARGVPASAIEVLGGATHSTWSDAQAVARAVEAEPGRQIAIVTNHYHTRRARWVFGSVIPADQAELHYFSVPTDRFRPDDWWHSRAGVSLVLQEYLKLVFYWLFYGPGLWWVAGVGLLAAIARTWRRKRGRRLASA